MTGRFPGEVGIHSALECSPLGCAGFVDPAAYPTVTNILNDNGYTCGHFGKWHMGMSSDTTDVHGNNITVRAPSPCHAYVINSSATFDSNAVLTVQGNARIPLYPDAPILLPPIHPKNPQWNALSSAAVTNATLQFIDNVTAATLGGGSTAPWYTNTWYHAAHDTLDPTLDQHALVGNKTGRAMSPNAGQTTCADEIYYAAILDADTQIGRLFGGLQARGVWTNTVIALSSDNGPEVRWSYPNSVGTTGPFRGQKRSLYDGGVRLPFMVAWPGHGPGGNIGDVSVVSGVD